MSVCLESRVTHWKHSYTDSTVSTSTKIIMLLYPVA